MEKVKLHHDKTRVGRGHAAGQGKTSGRGTKGQNARNGKKRYTGFMTGALPLAQRLPKFAGNKPARPHYSLTTDQLARYFKEGETVTLADLQNKGLVNRVTGRTVIKVVLGKTKLTVTLDDPRITTSRSVAA